ncbi:MAG: T9SS type A sorting domain-containing protein [Flavobacteriaceae bacterium]|nr:T9SS type A sorting domain-containing protein [Flavobacteriaceae bacterium]
MDMLKYLFFTVLLFWGTTGQCQFGPQQVIAQTANVTQIIVAVDIDGDGNIDVVSANKFGNSITWYKNLDGLGNFGSENTVASLSETTFVCGSDLDGDGDIDLIAVAYFIDLVVWYENLDGQGNFSTQKVISNQADGSSSVSLTDIDGDGDMDVISASDFSGLAWYENLDGQGNFSSKKIIDNTISNSRSVVAVDMDGDGDIDVLGNASGSLKIIWIENMDGIGNFDTRHIIYDTGAYTRVVFAADVDNDGDADVFSSSSGDNEIAWFENIDGFGNFGPKNSITSTLINAWTVYAADLDNDGDMDVLATSVETFGGEIVWFENLDGMGNFSGKKIINAEVQSPRSVIAADIDNDGDMDVISSSQNDDKIAWYENMTIVGVDENQLNILKIYPNPTKGLVFINSKAENIVGVTVFDILGKKVFQVEGNIQQMDISNLQNGMYFLRLNTDDGDFVQKIIKD